ncbi:laccase [Clostridium novyi A str. 4552]|uniref:Purine nucleoside phosphorylase n=1 Tax=Clostridium novyi A str. 4552 TaxID=1444289 RepID=A0A0A0I8X4_CLONO|nr:peptidoglycan editing factor PgeF [Clostridium novyi]KGM96095.1 laccase [Clostridium novyi A str. 4552]
MKEANSFKVNNFEFLSYDSDKVGIYFSTAKGNLDFNKNTEDGLLNLQNLKEWFNVKEVGYLNQTHSDEIFNYDSMEHDGDALITNKKEVIIGVFTADCVPVIIYDRNNLVIAAIHSGWKGTINYIVSKTIDRLINDYNSKVEDLEIYIGPHNMMCCYEVSMELIETFKGSNVYKDTYVNDGRKLSLQKCIIKQLKDKGITNNQINTINMCTYCSKEYSFHSYRKTKEKSGRMFSFTFIK